MKAKSAITGLGYTAQGKVPGQIPLSFCIKAGWNAFDAGLPIKDIDGLIIEAYPGGLGQNHVGINDPIEGPKSFTEKPQSKNRRGR